MAANLVVLNTLNAAQQRMILILMAVSTFVLGAYLSITSVAIPTIVMQLHLTPLGMSWIVIADTLAMSGLLIVGGSLNDLVGHRFVLTAGLLCYVASGSLPRRLWIQLASIAYCAGNAGGGYRIHFSGGLFADRHLFT